MVPPQGLWGFAASLSARAVCHCLWLVLWDRHRSGWFGCPDFGPAPFFVPALFLTPRSSSASGIASCVSGQEPCELVPRAGCAKDWNQTQRDLRFGHEGPSKPCSCSAPSYRSDHLRVPPTRARRFRASSLGLSLHIQIKAVIYWGKWILAVRSSCLFIVALLGTFLALVTQEFLNGLCVQMYSSISALLWYLEARERNAATESQNSRG